MPRAYNLFTGLSGASTDPGNVAESSSGNIVNGVRVVIDETLTPSDKAQVVAALRSIKQYIATRETWPPA